MENKVDVNKRRIEDVKKWYSDYYKNNSFRNDLRENPEVLFQILATETSVVKAFQKIKDSPVDSLVLNVGCGNGADNFQLLRLHYKIENICGIDINDERLSVAQHIFPNSTCEIGDASKMRYADNYFDIVFESTMFSTLSNDNLCNTIASEMIRVCKPNAHIVLVDWKIPKPNNPSYNALTKKKLFKFFKVGLETDLIYTTRGALIPPIGRFLSKYIHGIYFLVSSFLPFFVGQVVYVLKKK